MKKKSIAVTSVMAAVLFGFSAYAWVKAPDTFSDSERRKLEQFPKISLETVMDGSFMDDFEAYTLDQFPFRDEFRRLKAKVVFEVLGQKDNNDIYVADGYASKMEYPLNEPMLDYAAERFFYIYENYLQEANNIYFSIVPDKNYFLAEDHGYLSLDYDALIQSMREKTDYMTYIDLTDHLELEDYYKTDTHWRQEKLEDVANALLSEMGVALEQGGVPEMGVVLDSGIASEQGVALEADGYGAYQVNLLEHPFYGVYYGQSALDLEPDTIQYLTSEALEHCIVTSYDTGAPVTIPMYDMEKAVGKDPYEMFLSGTRAILTIENPETESEKELIVFRDSFGSSLIPLLAEHYKTITVVDIRYVNSQVLDQFVDFGSQDVLFLYSTILLNNSMALH